MLVALPTALRSLRLSSASPTSGASLPEQLPTIPELCSPVLTGLHISSGDFTAAHATVLGSLPKLCDFAGVNGLSDDIEKQIRSDVVLAGGRWDQLVDFKALTDLFILPTFVAGSRFSDLAVPCTLCLRTLHKCV